ncbi:WD40-repeat-containing domain protein [Geopyxis carbonaria]|nr:WD40-repeat-containing domain protein [Geopyxis carbonaria]
MPPTTKTKTKPTRQSSTILDGADGVDARELQLTTTTKPKSKKSKPKKKKSAPAVPDPKNAAIPPDADEVELQKLVFGDLDGFRTGLETFETPSSDDEDVDMHQDEAGVDAVEIAALRDDELFFIDDANPTADTNPGALVVHNAEDTDAADAADVPAWEDSDDDRLTVSLAAHSRTRKLRDTAADDAVTGRDYAARLRRQFERIYPTPDWALPQKPAKRARHEQSDSDSDSDVDMDGADAALSAPPLSALLATTTQLTAAKSLRLRPEVIDIVRVADANIAARSKSGIQCLSFHPTHPLLLTSGFDSTLRLYHIDGTHNPLATSLHIRSSPLTTALFHPSGTRIIASGRRRYFHTWDLATGAVEKVSNVYGHAAVQKSMERLSPSPCGRYLALIGSAGTVQLLDAGTMQWLASAQIEGDVAAVAWAPSGDSILAASRAGEVYDFSMATHAVTAVWRDEGAVSLTALACSARFIAVGQASGIVNIYDRTTSFAGAGADPKPMKTIESLTTPVHVLSFSGDGQVLALASRAKKDALRLVHLPSGVVYRNWPTQQTPLGRVSAVAWARGSGMMAVGNEGGSVRLFEIRG